MGMYHDYFFFVWFDIFLYCFVRMILNFVMEVSFVFNFFFFGLSMK